MRRLLKKILGKTGIPSKFAADVGWNVVSFGIMGISGILLNILIAGFYNPAVLGVFNQIYSLYIVLSQLAVSGIHFSILKNAAHYQEDREEVDLIVSSGLYLTAFNSIVLVIVCFFSRGLWIGLFDSVAVEVGFIYALPALFFFALNKIYLAFHNAHRRMKAYALFQSLRYLLFLLIFLVLRYLSVEGSKIAVLFTITEFLLFVVLFLFSLRYFRFSFSRGLYGWLKKNICFGGQSMVGNLLLDANTRLDVLMLGIFASDRVVGIYSFASMLADGFKQLPVVLRTNINPILTRYRFTRSAVELENMVKRVRKMCYILLVPAGIFAMACFPLLVHVFSLSGELLTGWPVFMVLLSGLILSSGYLPFQMILNQAGKPLYQTLLLLFIFLTNFILNLALIPVLGMMGAAMATGISSVSFVFYLKVLTGKQLRIKI